MIISDTIKIVPPCKDCPDRSADCHGKCWKYKKYKKDYARAKAEYLASTNSERLINGYEIERAKRLFNK